MRPVRLPYVALAVARLLIYPTIALALAACDVGGVKRGFVVQGRVFRDTCRAGFETPASTYIRGEGFAFYWILGRRSTLVRDRL
ncbi:hypothetical protein B296_00012164 [Ensete ventricosum]|uniref:Uncharacterized protein n=1 Tax=Ensete ventricosum TaxID=4639 RepID=A0A427B5G3_ENSVE|nr:hypothetical protein B296_00012164 [Ensete ventricosum]